MIPTASIQDNKKKIFHCKVCDVTFNDSLSYVDHLNGKRHNRVLGMNLKVERVGADKIKDKLDKLALLKNG
jgi:U4/U6.U5 tri-snRNP component SNU23